jgi:hypothetical protein
LTTTERLKISRNVSVLCQGCLFFVLTIAATNSFAIHGYGNVGTDEAKKLDELIGNYKHPAIELKNALYPGIDLNQIIRYCDRVKDEPGSAIHGNNKEFQRCFTPLGVACFELGRSGNENRNALLLDKMKVLVENGASVEHDPPVLFQAIRYNKIDLASSILEKGIDVNKLRARASIKLDGRHVMSVPEPLVQKTCNENEYRPDEITIDTSEYMYPIHAAAAEGSHEMLDLLLAHGADCTLKDFFGQTVMQWAKERSDGDKYIVQRIQQALPQPERTGHKNVITLLFIGAILIALFIGLKALVKPPRKKIPSRPAYFASPPPGISAPSGRTFHANYEKIGNTAIKDFAFSSVKPKPTSRFSLRDRSYFTLFVSLLPWLFLGLKVIVFSNLEEDALYDQKIIGTLYILSLLILFSWLWALLVSIRFIIDDIRKAQGSYTWIGYLGVLITLALLILNAISSNNRTLRLGQGSEPSSLLTTALKQGCKKGTFIL